MLPFDNFSKQMVEKVHNCHFNEGRSLIKLLFEVGLLTIFSFFEKQGLSYVLAIRRKP